MAIDGVFFPNQVLKCRALGSFARKAVSDGILGGCAMAYSGTTITIQPGYVIACGRVIEVTEATAVDASIIGSRTTGTSDPAYILLTVTNPNTEPSFDVAVSLTDTSSASSVDMNTGADPTYITRLATIATSNNAITGITPREASCASGGSGGGSSAALWTNPNYVEGQTYTGMTGEYTGTSNDPSDWLAVSLSEPAASSYSMFLIDFRIDGTFTAMYHATYSVIRDVKTDCSAVYSTSGGARYIYERPMLITTENGTTTARIGYGHWANTKSTSGGYGVQNMIPVAIYGLR